jgi:hypothetical protein
MKKVSTLAVCMVTVLLFVSCQKEKEPVNETLPRWNRVISASSGEKAGSSTFLLISIGHSAKGCNGCIWDNGEWVHVDCMGEGNYCSKATAVQFQQIGSDIIATTTDTFGLTSEDFFVMPDRSLNYTDENNNRIFLNIPAQQVYRDSVTQQFTFTGLFFSEAAVYTNN